MANERAYWLAWAALSGVGPVLIKRIYEQFGSLAIAWDADLPALVAVDGIGGKLAETIIAHRPHLSPTVLLEQQLKTSPNFWTPADAAYPRLLFEITDPPPVLYYRGNAAPELGQGSLPIVGDVGTRSPSNSGKRWT